MEIQIRPAYADDAETISRVVIASLRETNAKDYPPEIIKQIEQSFSPSSVLELMAKRIVFVAMSEGRVVGTASLDGRVVRTVFVTPGAQGLGIGRMLMSRVEQAARETGVAVLAVPSSVTAERFYSKLGFIAVRDSYHGEERTIIMERTIAIDIAPIGQRQPCD